MHLQVDRWTIEDLTLNPEKAALLWTVIKRHRTLFSDLTRDDPNNFVRAILSDQALWFEVRERGILVGIIWFGDLHLITELTAHMAFFDRRSHEKIAVCKAIVKWAFTTFPIHRMNVMPPDIYVATIRLLRKIGFKEEGRKRESMLLDGKWRDQVMFGITRTEAEAL